LFFSITEHRIHKPTQAQDSKAFRLPFSAAFPFLKSENEKPTIPIRSSGQQLLQLKCIPAYAVAIILTTFCHHWQLSTLNLITNYTHKLLIKKCINIMLSKVFQRHKLKYCQVLQVFRNIFRLANSNRNCQKEN